MVQVVIRCHPCVPVSDELERWLEAQVEGIGAGHREETVRLSRLTQRLPTTKVDIGWLIDLDLPDAERASGAGGLASVLRDMRLLGLHPTVLTAVAVGRDRHDGLPIGEIENGEASP